MVDGGDSVAIKQDHAKILAMFILGVGSYLSGIIPAGISASNQRRYPLLLSLLLCFGAGVLLATSMVHMLPEVREDMPNNCELIFCIGFFLIYFIDELMHLFFGKAMQHSHGSTTETVNAAQPNQPNERNRISQQSYQSYGSADNTERQSLLAGNSDIPESDLDQSHSVPNVAQECENAAASNAEIYHVSHIEPCTESMTGTLGLLVALSLHSLFEGLAIGVQNSGSKVMLLLGAVSCHKFVMSFCLGVQFCSNPATTIKSHFVAILIFSFGSVAGIGIGMGIVDLPDSLTKSILPIFQALAAGTLLYVTVCEVLPREKSKWHQNPRRKVAGIAQFLAVSGGFTLMALLSYYLSD